MAPRKKPAGEAAPDETKVADTIADTAAAGAIEGAGAEPESVGSGETLPVVEEEGGEREAPATAAPAEDHITAFDRRCERLVTIAEEAEFESGSLVGDIRDALLDVFKTRPKPWTQMSQGEQADLARTLEAVAKQFVRKTVLVIAQEDDKTVEGTLLPQFTVKGDAIEAKIKIESVDDEGVIDVYRLAGHKVVVVSADATRFAGQRRGVETMPDQPRLKFESGEARTPKPEPEHPADDSDLAGGGEVRPEVERLQVRTDIATGMLVATDPENPDDVRTTPATLTQLAEAEPGSTWRVNRDAGLVQRLPQGGDTETGWEDIREATPDEMAAEGAEPEPLFRVWAEDDSPAAASDARVYLDATEDTWTGDPTKAGAWAKAYAEELATAHDANGTIAKD